MSDELIRALSLISEVARRPIYDKHIEGWSDEREMKERLRWIAQRAKMELLPGAPAQTEEEL